MPRHHYSFADADAPALKHLLGVRAFATHMIRNEEAVKAAATTKRDQAWSAAKIDAFRQILDVLDHSELIVNAQPAASEREDSLPSQGGSKS